MKALRFSIVFKTLFFIGCFIYAQLPVEITQSLFELVWEDNFDGAPLDPQKWCRTDPRKGKYGRYPFAAFRTDGNENISFSTAPSGEKVIVLEARHETVIAPIALNVNDNTFHAHLYQYSAPTLMTSQMKFRYGFFEIRCKLPVLAPNETNAGVGANFWLWMTDTPTSFNAQSEIDIFEFINEPPFGPHRLTCNMHKSYGLFPDPVEDGTGHYPGPNWTGFHTFGVLWTPSLILYYMDGQPYHTSTRSNYADQLIPMAILLDINVFTFSSDTALPSTKLPYDYMIDYVRVYQLDAQQCNNSYVQCSPMNAQESIYRNIEFGGGCSLPAASQKKLTASEYILIDPGFTAPLGSELTMSIVSPCYNSLMIPCPVNQCGHCE